MKKVFTFAVLFAAVLLVSQYFNVAISAENTKPAGYISLSASKETEIEPNTATIRFAIESTASDAKSAAAENNKASNKIVNALKTIATDKDVLKTTNFSINPVYNTTSSGKRVIKNYVAVNSVLVETKDVSKVPNFIDSAISNGANRTDSLSYSYKNDRSICNDMYPELIKDITSQARIIAQNAGSTLDGIKQLNASCSMDSSLSTRRVYMAKGVAMDSVEEAAAAPAIEPGKVKVRVYVNADFYVK
ncbi:SIMPL domain-containing protein [bacterium]|nr:SIMPL domain-containing protein [bacterium]